MTVEEKALELVAENRVVLVRRGLHRSPGDLAIVAGQHDAYVVEALETGIACECPARTERCAHVLAAMVVWAESSVRPW